MVHRFQQCRALHILSTTLFPPGTNFKVLSVKIDPDTGTRKIIMINIMTYIDNFSDSEKNNLPDHQIKPLITENEEQEFIAPNMTEEEKEILDQLRRDSDLRDQILEDVTYSNFPPR
jgi:hypothetical protein